VHAVVRSCAGQCGKAYKPVWVMCRPVWGGVRASVGRRASQRGAACNDCLCIITCELDAGPGRLGWVLLCGGLCARECMAIAVLHVMCSWRMHRWIHGSTALTNALRVLRPYNGKMWMDGWLHTVHLHRVFGATSLLCGWGPARLPWDRAI